MVLLKKEKYKKLLFDIVGYGSLIDKIKGDEIIKKKDLSDTLFETYGSQNQKNKNNIYLVPLIKKKPDVIDYNYFIKTNCFFNDCNEQYIGDFISQIEKKIPTSISSEKYNDSTGDMVYGVSDKDFDLALTDCSEGCFFYLKLNMPTSDRWGTIDNIIKRQIINYINTNVKKYNNIFTKEQEKIRIDIGEDYKSNLRKLCEKFADNNIINNTLPLFLETGIIPITTESDITQKKAIVHFPEPGSKPIIRITHLDYNSGEIKNKEELYL
jgi:hypothetical protein